MELSDLQLFCDVVEMGSFSRAAEKNFVSQSAVSQRIRGLERTYGHVLIERGRGKKVLVPTEAGQILLEGAKPILNQAVELDAQLRGISDEITGTVRVATVYSVGLHALPGRLKPFLAVHPKVNVHLEYSQTSKVYRDVASGAVDVGIVACATPRAGIEVTRFGEDSMVLICAPEHPLAQSNSIELCELTGQPFIAFSDDIPTRHLIDDHLRAAGAQVRIVLSFDNIETIKNLVEIGSGVAIVPENSVQREAQEGVLCVLPLAPRDAFRRPIGLLVKKSQSHRAAVTAFVQAMRN